MNHIDIILIVIFCILFLICETKSESYDSIKNNKPVTLLYPDVPIAIVTMYTVDTQDIYIHALANLKYMCNTYKYGLYVYFKSPQKSNNDKHILLWLEINSFYWFLCQRRHVH